MDSIKIQMLEYDHRILWISKQIFVTMEILDRSQKPFISSEISIPFIFSRLVIIRFGSNNVSET